MTRHKLFIFSEEFGTFSTKDASYLKKLTRNDLKTRSLFFQDHHSPLETDQPVSQCQFCPQQLPSSLLKQHVSNVHGAEMPFSCELCGKGFLTRSGLNHHMNTHRGRRFVCPICDQKFNQSPHLKKHLQRIHKLSLCPTCSRPVPVGDEFNQHVVNCAKIPQY